LSAAAVISHNERHAEVLLGRMHALAVTIEQRDHDEDRLVKLGGDVYCLA
jgi:hypothetical protein